MNAIGDIIGLVREIEALLFCEEIYLDERRQGHCGEFDEDNEKAYYNSSIIESCSSMGELIND